MKKIIKKFTAIIQILIIMTSAVITLFNFSTTTVLAKIPSEWHQMAKLSTSAKQTNFKVYVGSYDVAGEKVIDISNSASDNVRISDYDKWQKNPKYSDSGWANNWLLVDRKSTIYFDYDANITIQRVGTNGIIGTPQNMGTGNSFTFSYGLPEQFRITLSRKKGFVYKEELKESFYVKIRDNNEVYFSEGDNPNAIYENGVIYGRAGETVSFQTKWKNENGGSTGGRNGYFYEIGKTGKIFNVSGYNVTLPPSSVASARFGWMNDYGSVANNRNDGWKIKSSNFVTDAETQNAYTLNVVKHTDTVAGINKDYTLYAKVEKINDNRYGFNTQRNIGLNTLYGTLTLELNLKRADKNIPVVVNEDAGNQVNVTGANNVRYENNKCYMDVELHGNEHRIQVSYYDYLGNKHNTEWHIGEKIEQEKTETYKKTVHVEDKATNKKSSGKKNISDGGSGGGSGSGGGNDSGGGYYSDEDYSSEDYSYDYAESYSCVKPYWERVKREFEQNERKYEYVIQDSRVSGWCLVQRSNPYIQVNPDYIDWHYGLGADGGTFSIDSSIQKEGVYDLFIYTEDYNGNGYVEWTDTLYLGGKYSVKEPVIQLLNNGERDEATGCVSLKYSVENCTQLKYRIIKRENPEEPYDPNIVDTYDSFDGTIVNNPKELNITINPVETGGGVYDVIVYGICRDASDEYLNIRKSFDTKGIECYINPNIQITQNEDELNKKTYKVSTDTIDGVKITDRRYAIVKQSTYGEPVKLTEEQIKNPATVEKIVESGTYTDGQEFEFDISKLGAGYYSLVCYAENDKNGRKFTKFSNILLTNGPSIEYTIRGEDESKGYSDESKYVQYVDISTKDDIAPSCTVQYFASSEDYTKQFDGKLDMDMFYNNNKVKEKSTSINLNNGEKKEIKLTATKGEDKYVYLYALVRPDGPNSTVVNMIRTGAIRLNGKEMELKSIHVGNFDKKEYAIGDTLDIVVTLSHPIDEEQIYPALKIKVGDKELTSTNCKIEGQIATYSFEIDETVPSGEISLEDFEYIGSVSAFYAKDASDYTFRNSIKSTTDIWYNFVDKQGYTVDISRPTIQSVEIDIKANAIDGVDEENHSVKYIKDFENVKITAKYSEEVNGNSIGAYINKGNKILIPIYSSSLDDKTEEVFDITDDLKRNDVSIYDGELIIQSIGGKSYEVNDKAGNNADFEQPYNVIYKLNGEPVNSKIIFDSHVDDAELYVGETRIDDLYGIYNTGVEYKCFAECDLKKNCLDASGLQNVQLNIDYTGQNVPVEVKDCRGNVLTNANYTISSSQTEGFDNVIKYNISADKLPVTFKFNNEELYRVEAIKTDKVGNTSKKSTIIETIDRLSISQEKSGMLNLDEDKMYCLNDIEDSDKKYTLVLKSSDSINFNNVNVYINNEVEPIKYVESTTEGSIVYGKYEFDVNRTGKYEVKVTTKDGEELLKDFVKVMNVYKIGDTDFDGKISISDLAPILKYIAKFDGYRDEVIAYAGNIDGSIRDGKPDLDVTDVRDLAKFLAEDESVIMRRSDKDIPYTNKGGI